MHLRIPRQPVIGRIFIFAVATGLFIGAALEFYNVSWGTGTWWGEFSLKWGMAFFLFVIFCLLSLLATGSALWNKQKTEPLLKRLAAWRERMGRLGWLLAFVILILPIWLFQYSPWGVAFNKPFIRLLVWGFAILFLSFFITRDPLKALAWPEILIVILFSLAAGTWKLNLLQKLSILLPLFAFLVVGLIVSTKIGGGGDLHNMDMFLIALMFSAALAWKAACLIWMITAWRSSPGVCRSI